jgi:hypothetical protein
MWICSSFIFNGDFLFHTFHIPKGSIHFNANSKCDWKWEIVCVRACVRACVQAFVHKVVSVCLFFSLFVIVFVSFCLSVCAFVVVLENICLCVCVCVLKIVLRHFRKLDRWKFLLLRFQFFVSLQNF